jgi:hypothetical protein
MKYSKNLSDGVAVRIHGGKVIRCGANRKPIGVFKEERPITMMVVQSDGNIGRVRTFLPKGIQVFGECLMKVNDLVFKQTMKELSNENN